MKRIIALYGHAECGKSTTMNFLREMIRRDGVSMSSYPPYDGEKRETFLYKEQVICLCPGGDDFATVQGNFEYASLKNADIIITACRTKGDTVKVVNQKAREFGIVVEWFRKSYEYHLCAETQALCNQEFAKVMFERL